jgi:hypothetical protein
MAEAHKVQIKPSAMHCPILINHCHTLRDHLLDHANSGIHYCWHSSANAVFCQTAFQVMILYVEEGASTEPVTFGILYKAKWAV